MKQLTRKEYEQIVKDCIQFHPLTSIVLAEVSQVVDTACAVLEQKHREAGEEITAETAGGDTVNVLHAMGRLRKQWHIKKAVDGVINVSYLYWTERVNRLQRIMSEMAANGYTMPEKSIKDLHDAQGKLVLCMPVVDDVEL